MTCNASSNIHSAMKRNNVINNQKGNVSRNSKINSKISNVNNKNSNMSISSKKQINFVKQRKIINDNKK